MERRSPEWKSMPTPDSLPWKPNFLERRSSRYQPYPAISPALKPFRRISIIRSKCNGWIFIRFVFMIFDFLILRYSTLKLALDYKRTCYVKWRKVTSETCISTFRAKKRVKNHKVYRPLAENRGNCTIKIILFILSRYLDWLLRYKDLKSPWYLEK